MQQTTSGGTVDQLIYAIGCLFRGRENPEVTMWHATTIVRAALKSDIGITRPVS